MPKTYSISRRRTLTLLGGLATAVTVAPNVTFAKEAAAVSSDRGQLPQAEIEKLLQVSGSLKEGVFSADIGRKDLKVVGPHGIPFTAAFQLHHEVYMQSLGANQAMLNAEVALLPKELDGAIDAILAHGLVFQAEHQHFVNLTPQIFHIHFRGEGEPAALAKAMAAVVSTTGTPLPQKKPGSPKTPLDAKKLGQILGGEAEVAEDGVVSVAIPRKEKILLGGRQVSPMLGVMSHVEFQPLDDNSTGDTAVAPDFALLASEVGDVMRETRKGGFEIHCLYNQETAEQPQLYFSHQLAVGNA